MPRKRKKSARKPKVLALFSDDFIGGIALMHATSRGIYISLLVLQRNKGPLPFDVGRLSRASGCTPKEFQEAWEHDLECCFETDDQGRIFNARVERDRLENEEYRQDMSKLGKRGAAARWGKEDDGDTPEDSARHTEGHDESHDNGHAKKHGLDMASPALASSQARSPSQIPSRRRKKPAVPTMVDTPQGAVPSDPAKLASYARQRLAACFSGDDDEGMERDEFQSLTLMAYRALPFTPDTGSPADLATAGKLYDQGYHLLKVLGGLATVWNRRKPDAKPVRSLAYFREAVLAYVVEDEDVDRSRERLQELWEGLIGGLDASGSQDDQLTQEARE